MNKLELVSINTLSSEVAQKKINEPRRSLNSILDNMIDCRKEEIAILNSMKSITTKIEEDTNE